MFNYLQEVDTTMIRGILQMLCCQGMLTLYCLSIRTISKTSVGIHYRWIGSFWILRIRTTELWLMIWVCFIRTTILEHMVFNHLQCLIKHFKSTTKIWKPVFHLLSNFILRKEARVQVCTRKRSIKIIVMLILLITRKLSSWILVGEIL